MPTANRLSLGTIAARVTALVVSRMRGSELSAELNRLQAATALRSGVEIAMVIGALFGTAILAAMFGWIGLAIYFSAILLIFR